VAEGLRRKKKMSDHGDPQRNQRVTQSPALQPEKETKENLPLDELEKRLDTTLEGLSHEEAEKRLAQYGPNALEEKKVNPLLKFLSYFWGPIPWMIEVAAILSAVVRHWVDLIIILVLLAFNAVVGFWQEHQASNAV
jgi:H+-transporting ATPase